MRYTKADGLLIWRDIKLEHLGFTAAKIHSEKWMTDLFVWMEIKLASQSDFPKKRGEKNPEVLSSLKSSNVNENVTFFFAGYNSSDRPTACVHERERKK